MVVAKWAKAVVVALICSGLALGQQYQPHPTLTTENGKQIMEVPELGPGRKAEVVRSWRQADGKIVYELKDTITGERLLVIDQDHPVVQSSTAAPPKRRSVFNWKKDPAETVIATTPLPADATVVPGSERVISSRVISETVTPMSPTAAGEKLTPISSYVLPSVPQGQVMGSTVVSESPMPAPRKGLFKFSRDKQAAAASPYAPAPMPAAAGPEKVIASTVISEEPMPAQKKGWFGREKPVDASAYTPMPTTSYAPAPMDQVKVIGSTVSLEQSMAASKKGGFGKEKPDAISPYTPAPTTGYVPASMDQAKVIGSTVIAEQPMPTQKKGWFGKDKSVSSGEYVPTPMNQSQIISSPAMPEETMPGQKKGLFGKDTGVPQTSAPAPVSVQDKVISTTLLSETVVPLPGQGPVVAGTPIPMGTAAAIMPASDSSSERRPSPQAIVPQPVIVTGIPGPEQTGMFVNQNVQGMPRCCEPRCCEPRCPCMDAGKAVPSPAPVIATEIPQRHKGLFHRKDKEPYTVLPPAGAATTVQTTVIKPEPLPIVTGQTPASPTRHSIFSLHRDKPVVQSKLAPQPVAANQQKPESKPGSVAAVAKETTPPKANAAVPVKTAEIQRPTPNPMEQRPMPTTPPVPAAQASIPMPAGSSQATAGEPATKKASLFSWNREQTPKPTAQATIPAPPTPSKMDTAPTPATALKTEPPKTPVVVIKPEAPKPAGDVTQAKATWPGDSKPAAAASPAKVDSAWDYARKADDAQIKVEKTSTPAVKEIPVAQEKRDSRTDYKEAKDSRADYKASAPAAPGRPEKVQAPLGSGSVLAASGGKPGAVVYVPVPMMTMPQVTRAPVPPMPPPPQIPQPPKAPILPGSVDEANAFMPKPPPSQVGPDPGQTGAGNAFTVVQGPNSEGQGAFMNRGSGYPAAMPPRQPMNYGGYGMMPPYASMPQPNYQTVYVPMAQPGYPAPYGSMPQMQYPQPQYPQAYAAQPQAGYPLAQAKPQAAAEVVPAGYAPAKEPANEIARQLMRILHDSMYPSERERAADNLTTRDWHSNPAVVDALVKSAQEDPAATVRAACVRGLAKMGVNTVPVGNALHSLKADSDPRVRREVELAATALGLR